MKKCKLFYPMDIIVLIIFVLSWLSVLGIYSSSIRTQQELDHELEMKKLNITNCK